MIHHEFRYYHPDGTLGEIGAWNKFDCLYGVNGIGEIIILAPLPDDKPRHYFSRWGKLEFWRYIDGIGYLEGDRIWRLQYRRIYHTEAMERMIELRFMDDNWLLKRRGIIYWLGNNIGSTHAPADDMMKQMVREQLGSSASLSRYAPTITVAANLGLGADLQWPIGYKNLYDTLVEVSDKTKDGTPVYFDMVRTGMDSSEFRTFITNRGADRGLTSNNPFVINLNAGLLDKPSLTEDWRDECNYIYAFGEGEGSNRDMQHYPANYPANPLELSEAFLERSDIPAGQSTKLLEAAHEEYNKLVMKPRFEADLNPSREIIYGRDLHYGDQVVTQYEGYTCNSQIRAVRIVVDENNYETVTIHLEDTTP